MSKKYFAKYLPVEGEIKEVGDVALYPNGFSETASSETLSDLIGNTACKKAKLFLCSRDIQVGDKFIFDDDLLAGPFEVISKETKISAGQAPIDSIQGKGFKIIGEISPDATWVKEGDEFDEEDIYMCRAFRTEHGDVWDRPWESDFEVITLFQIKGPCGHFH